MDKKDTRHGFLILGCDKCIFKITEHIHVYREMPRLKDCLECPGKLKEIGFNPCSCKLNPEDYRKKFR